MGVEIDAGMAMDRDRLSMLSDDDFRVSKLAQYWLWYTVVTPSPLHICLAQSR